MPLNKLPSNYLTFNSSPQIEFQMLHRVSRDIDTKKVYQISMWWDALYLQYEPLPYLKIF
jgi:hypothetical protein